MRWNGVRSLQIESAESCAHGLVLHLGHVLISHILSDGADQIGMNTSVDGILETHCLVLSRLRIGCLGLCGCRSSLVKETRVVEGIIEGRSNCDPGSRDEANGSGLEFRDGRG